MNGSTRFRTALVLAALLLPALHLAAQGRGAIAPQNQADELRKGTDFMYDKKLAPVEEALRNDVILLRDSLDVVSGYANRLERSVQMPAVSASAMRELRPACASAARTVKTIRPRLAEVKIKSADVAKQGRVERILKEYKAAFDQVGVLMASCEKTAALAIQGKKTPEEAAAMGAQLSKEILAYEGQLRSTLNEFDIPLRPKQQSGK